MTYMIWTSVYKINSWTDLEFFYGVNRGLISPDTDNMSFDYIVKLYGI